MKSKISCITAMTLMATLAISIPLAAQNSQGRDNEGHHKDRHHHYRVIDLGTFGGPSSWFNHLNLTDAFGFQILQAMAVGSLAPSQAAQLLGAIAAQAKIVEVDALARRIEVLEKRLAGNGSA